MATHAYRPPTALGRLLDHVADVIAWLWQKYETALLAASALLAGGAVATVVILFSQWFHRQHMYGMEMAVLFATFLLAAAVFAWIWEGRP